MISIAAFLPHGVQIVPKVEQRPERGFKELHHAMMDVKARFDALKPTTIVLITPHGIAIDEHLGIYYNKLLGGKIAFDHHVLSKEFTFENNIEIASTLHRTALDHGFRVTRIVAGVVSSIGLLQWGELVPLYYTAHLLVPKPQIVVISTPFKRYEKLDELAPELIMFGEFLGSFLENHEQHIGVVVSGDLSHVHNSDGPYGYHESCTEFDNIILRWLEGDNDSLLLKKALPLDATAKSCGLAPLLILQGIFKSHDPKTRNVLAYRVPSYFGMAVSTFTY